MPTTLPISKIRTPDGMLYDFSTTHQIVLPDTCVLSIVAEEPNWSTSQISGSDYLLTITTSS